MSHVMFSLYTVFVKSVNSPIRTVRRQLEQGEKRCADQKAVLEKQYQKSVHSLKSKGSAIEAAVRSD